MDCSLPGSSVHGILQARTLEWVAISFSRESSQSRDQTLHLKSPALAGRFLFSQVVLVVKNPPDNEGDTGFTPELGRSLENEMATHSSILAWKIPWKEEPGRLKSTGLQE